VVNNPLSAQWVRALVDRNESAVLGALCRANDVAAMRLDVVADHVVMVLAKANICRRVFLPAMGMALPAGCLAIDGVGSGFDLDEAIKRFAIRAVEMNCSCLGYHTHSLTHFPKRTG
jgi:hypothetical protein